MHLSANAADADHAAMMRLLPLHRSNLAEDDRFTDRNIDLNLRMDLFKRQKELRKAGLKFTQGQMLNLAMSIALELSDADFLKKATAYRTRARRAERQHDRTEDAS